MPVPSNSTVASQAQAESSGALRDRCEALKAALAAIGDLRPGSLVERYRRCGKDNCRCAVEGAAGHGPCWSLTREVAGKTVTMVIPTAAIEATRLQVAEYKRFKELASELIETSERLCDAQMPRPEAAERTVVKKKRASGKPSRPKSSGKSKR